MLAREQLSDRELDVLELALLGLTHQQIADRLFLSVETVRSHFKRAYAALADESGATATGALHAVALALQRGWMVFDPADRTIRRPPGRTPLPPDRRPPPSRQGSAAPRTPAERRRELGW